MQQIYLNWRLYEIFLNEKWFTSIIFDASFFFRFGLPSKRIRLKGNFSKMLSRVNWTFLKTPFS